MKLRYKHRLGNEWFPIDFQELKQLLRNASPTDGYEIRKQCEHKETFVMDGMRQCKYCGDVLRITSYRD